MPLYEYECDACGARFELIRKFSDPPVTVCPTCGQEKVRKLISSPAFQFKGSGWYVTDYARKSDDSSSTSAATRATAEAKADAKSDAKSGATPDTKPDAKTDAPRDAAKPAADKPAATPASDKPAAGASTPAASKDK